MTRANRVYVYKFHSPKIRAATLRGVNLAAICTYIYITLLVQTPIYILVQKCRSKVATA